MLLNLFIFIIFITSYINLYTSILFIPLFALYFYNPIVSKKYFIIVKNILINTISFISKTLLFKKVFINSNEIFSKLLNNENEKNIIISSHPSEIDFLISSIFFSSFSSIYSKNICVSKKNIGYYLPSIGFFGLLTGDIFLHRNIKKDILSLDSKIDFNNILIYPEGTCFNFERKKISDIYCKKNNLIKYNYHLYPRMTGLEIVIKNNSSIKYIYDITIVYDKINKNDYGKSFSIVNYLIGKNYFPNKVFINVIVYKVIPHKFNKKFIENLYLSKDNFIEKFDLNCNDFVPIKYNYIENFGYFALVNLFCILSLYLYYKFTFVRYLYFIQCVFFYFYFIFFV